jgi:elongation factor Ts
MTIKASDVKALRDITGAGMMACKKALAATNSLDEAIDFLRKLGEAKAANASTRTTAEGRVNVKANDEGEAVVLELNSETDFAAKNEDFVTFAELLTATALAKSPTDLDALMALKNPSGEGTLESYRQQLSSKIGENIHVRRFCKKTAVHPIGHYCHRERIGVLVILDQDKPELARDIAIHIAAMNPQAINSEGVSAQLIERERQIYLAQTKESGKSEEIAVKMVEGRIKKYLREITLVDQPFVKNPDVTIGSMLKSEGAQVLEFLRYELGEGIEKKVVNFREEVMQQAKGKT